MSADALYDELRSYLHLSYRLIEREGDLVNEGEQFSLRFTLTNGAYSAGEHHQPCIIFNTPRVWVKGTAYAYPAQGNRWVYLDDKRLYPGESTSFEMPFVARQTLGWFEDLFSAEKVADATVFADLDLACFFRLRNRINVHQEIEPG